MQNTKFPFCDFISDDPTDYIRVALAIETLAYYNKNYLDACIKDNCTISREIQSLLIEALKKARTDNNAE